MELFKVFSLSFTQSAVSAALSLVFGVWAALGLTAIKRPTLKKIIEALLMAPSFLPSLILIIGCLELLLVFGRFPFGWFGVVIVHVAVNMGLVSVVFARALLSQTGGAIELATIEGASAAQTLRAVFKELKSVLTSLFTFSFIFSFTSFSIPLVVGAQSGRTIETLIYETLVGRHDLKLAINYSLTQMALLLALTLIAPLKRQKTVNRASNLDLIATNGGLWVQVAFVIGLLLTTGSSFVRGAHDLLENRILVERISTDAWGTIVEATTAGLTALGLGALFAYFTPYGWVHRSLRFVVAPSAAILAVILILIFDLESWSNLSLILLIAVAFTAMIFATLFRIRLYESFNQISSEVEMAQILGANRNLIFTKIVWPLLAQDLGFIAGLAALWASGDFAFASLLAGRELTLGISAHTLLGGYRIEVATVLASMALAVGVFLFFIFQQVPKWLLRLTRAT